MRASASDEWPIGVGSNDCEPGAALLVRYRKTQRANSSWVALLASDERARAEQLRGASARAEFVQSRGLLRMLLGALLSREASTLPLEEDANGKPRLADEALAFSLSHSGDWCLLAFTQAPWIGVDIELVRPVPNASAFAQRFFTAREQAALARYRDGALDRAFLGCWTRKEAYLKGIGLGVGAELGRVDVDFESAIPAAIRVPSSMPPAVLHPLWLDEAHIGAVALPPGISVGRRREMLGASATA